MPDENCYLGTVEQILASTSGIDATGTTTAAFKVATPSRHVFNFNLWLNIVADGAVGPDKLIWELYPGKEGTTYADLPVREGVLDNVITTAIDVVIPIINFPFYDAKLKVKSSGADDTWTVVAEIQPWKRTEYVQAV